MEIRQRWENRKRTGNILTLEKILIKLVYNGANYVHFNEALEQRTTAEWENAQDNQGQSKLE